jgi:hypothetical protein
VDKRLPASKLHPPIPRPRWLGDRCFCPRSPYLRPRHRVDDDVQSPAGRVTYDDYDYLSSPSGRRTRAVPGAARHRPIGRASPLLISYLLARSHQQQESKQAGMCYVAASWAAYRCLSEQTQQDTRPGRQYVCTATKRAEIPSPSPAFINAVLLLRNSQIKLTRPIGGASPSPGDDIGIDRPGNKRTPTRELAQRRHPRANKWRTATAGALARRIHSMEVDAL